MAEMAEMRRWQLLLHATTTQLTQRVHRHTTAAPIPLLSHPPTLALLVLLLLQGVLVLQISSQEHVLLNVHWYREM